MLEKHEQFLFRDFFKTRDNFIILFLMIGASVILFGQTTQFAFVWDDMSLHLKYLLPISDTTLKDFWMSPLEKEYAPITFSLWAFIASLQKNALLQKNMFDPFLFHLINVIVHTGVGILVYVLIVNAVKRKWAALMGSLIFLIHPIQAHSVAWVSELRGLLATFFGLLGILFMLQACKEKNKIYVYLLYASGSIITLIISLLSKPSAIIIPLFALFMALAVFRLSFNEVLKILCIPLLCSIIIAVITVNSQDNYSHPNMEAPLWTRPLIWMYSISFYFYKIVFPLHLSASYGKTPLMLTNGWLLYVVWIVPIIIGIVAFRKLSKYRLLGAGYALFVIGFLPTSGLISFPFQSWSTVSDRYVYLSMVGIALSVSSLLTQKNKNYAYVSVVVVCVLLFIRSYYVQIPTWKNSFTLWNHCILLYPQEPSAYRSRAQEYIKMGKIPEALKDFDRSIALYPQNPKVYNDRGALFLTLNEYDRSIDDLNRALQLDPYFEDPYVNRAQLYFQTKKYSQAVNDIDAAIRINPLSYNSFCLRGILLHHLNRFSEAIENYSKAIEIYPYFAKAYVNRASIYFQFRTYSLALNDANTAVRIDSNYMAAFQLRARIYYELGQYSQAFADMEKVRLSNVPYEKQLWEKISAALKDSIQN